MKIAWFTPFVPEKTAIADWSAMLLPHLSAEFEVDYFINNVINEETNRFEGVRFFNYNKIQIKDLVEYQFVIYNMGNNSKYHKKILEIAYQHPGIIILHDGVLYELVQSFCENELDFTKYFNTLIYFYGNDIKEDIVSIFKKDDRFTSILNKYSHIEFVIYNSLGVIVHNKEILIKNKIDSPAITLGLPYCSNKVRLNKPFEQPSIYKLVLFGYLGFNRRVNSILEAIAKFNRKDKLQLTIMGEYHSDLIQLVDSLGLSNLVSFLGYVDEEILNSEIANSHLAFNLRFPTMDEASSSQLKLWSFSIPSIVTNIGWYSQIPNDTVLKVRVNNEIEDIHYYLDLLIDQPDTIKKTGKKGNDYLLKHHSCQNYVSGLLNFLTEISTKKKSQYNSLFKYGPFLDETKCKNEYFTNLKHIQHMENIFIWGAGSSGIQTLNLIRESWPNINVKGFIDSDKNKYGNYILGIMIYSPNILQNSFLQNQFVIVASTYVNEIEENLNQFGYKHGENYLIRVIEVPFLILI